MALEERDEDLDQMTPALNVAKLAIGKYLIWTVNSEANWLTLRLDQIGCEAGFMIRHLTLLFTKKWTFKY